MLYLKYLAWLLLITMLGAGLAAYLALTTAWAALAVSIAGLQCPLFALLTSARVLLGIAMARFSEAKMIEPVMLPLLARAVDVNDKITGVAADIGAEFKARAAGITGRLSLIGPAVAWLVRRAPAYLIERMFTARLYEVARLSGTLGNAPDLPTREERAHGLLILLRERLGAQAGETAEWLLWIYAGLCVVENAALFFLAH